VQKKNFGQTYGAKSFPGHCKLLLHHFCIDYANLESTLRKFQGRKLLEAPWKTLALVSRSIVI
jgi:hypothetical protein